jgi:hypothetical protein
MQVKAVALRVDLRELRTERDELGDDRLKRQRFVAARAAFKGGSEAAGLGAGGCPGAAVLRLGGIHAWATLAVIPHLWRWRQMKQWLGNILEL